MTDQQEYRFNLLGRALFMMLFLLIISVHVQRSEKQIYVATQYEILSEVHTDSGHAIPVDFIQAPSFQKSLASFIDKTGLSLFNDNYKISADNSRITQRIILLLKSFLSLKPISNCRFYYHLFHIDSQEPPLLS